MSTVALVAGALALVGCGATPDGSEGHETHLNQRAERTTSTEGEAGQGGNGSSEGVVDVEGGHTQDEQLAEMEAVVEVMREHFGEDVATIDGEPWSAELHDAEVTPRPEGDGVYRHEVRFDVPSGNLEETYSTAEEIADQLGLTENMNNSHGVTEHDKIFYGAGAAEGRGFLIASATSGDGYRAFYQTRLSDDPSLREAYDWIVDKNAKERRDKFGPDNPRQMEDIEGADESSSSD